MPSPKDLLEQKGYLTLNGLCHYLELFAPKYSVSYPTLKKFVEDGQIEFYLVGKQKRFPKSEVERFAQEGPRGFGNKGGAEASPESLQDAPYGVDPNQPAWLARNPPPPPNKAGD